MIAAWGVGSSGIAIAGPPAGEQPPRNLAKLVAEKEAAAQAERAQYMYTQSLTVEELEGKRGVPKLYREEREVVFSPSGERTEQLVGRPNSTLQRLRLTDEDFRDIYEVQSLMLTPEVLSLYDTQIKGEETVGECDCWVLRVRPRQILDGQRLFDGHLWVDKKDYSVVRSEGKPVPQMWSSTPGKENLFPYFTTVREKVNGHWFPVLTHSDDTLAFSSGPLRTRMTIRYRNYKKFGSESRLIVE